MNGRTCPLYSRSQQPRVQPGWLPSRQSRCRLWVMPPGHQPSCGTGSPRQSIRSPVHSAADRQVLPQQADDCLEVGAPWVRV